MSQRARLGILRTDPKRAHRSGSNLAADDRSFCVNSLFGRLDDSVGLAGPPEEHWRHVLAGPPAH